MYITDAAQVEKAAAYLLESARAAIRECAFREGINMLHHACRILDRVAVTVGTSRLKLDHCIIKVVLILIPQGTSAYEWKG